MGQSAMERQHRIDSGMSFDIRSWMKAMGLGQDNLFQSAPSLQEQPQPSLPASDTIPNLPLAQYDPPITSLLPGVRDGLTFIGSSLPSLDTYSPILPTQFRSGPRQSRPQSPEEGGYAVPQPKSLIDTSRGGAWDFIVPGGSGRTETGGTHGGKPAVDIFAPEGTPIVAPVDGTSSPANYPLGGNATTIRGDNGRFYYLAHGQRPFVGGRIRRGQVIGYVGRTGNARNTPAHLHYAVATNATYFGQWNGSGDLDPADN